LSEILELKYDLIKVLVESKLAKSKTEAKRLIKQGAIQINYKDKWVKIIKIISDGSHR